MTDNNIIEIKNLLSELIKNQCVNKGHKISACEYKNAETLKKFFKKNGIESEIFTWKEERSNLFVKLDSIKSNVPTIGFITHIDVVPADETQWQFNPFCGDEKDGYILGRGSVDMLGQTSAIAAAIVTMKKLYGENLPYNVRFYAFADEEAEGREGAEHFINNKKELLDCDIFFSELGGFSLGEFDKDSVTYVCAEKGVARVKLYFTGTAAHGSMTYKCDNAILKMAKVLPILENSISCYTETKSFKNFVDALYCKKCSASLNLLNEKTFATELEKIATVSKGLAKYLHGASCSTVSVGVVTGGTKVNIIPNAAMAELDLRLVEGETLTGLKAKFDKLVLDNEELDSYEITEWTESNCSDIDDILFQTILKKIKLQYPNKKFVPIVSSGVSDGRYFRLLGKPVFGFNMFAEDVTIDSYPILLHGVNEKIAIDSLKSMFNFYSAILS